VFLLGEGADHERIKATPTFEGKVDNTPLSGGLHESRGAVEPPSKQMTPSGDRYSMLTSDLEDGAHVGDFNDLRRFEHACVRELAARGYTTPHLHPFAQQSREEGVVRGVRKELGRDPHHGRTIGVRWQSCQSLSHFDERGARSDPNLVGIHAV
jgi:hypothetical protein